MRRWIGRPGIGAARLAGAAVVGAAMLAPAGARAAEAAGWQVARVGPAEVVATVRGSGGATLRFVCDPLSLAFEIVTPPGSPLFGRAGGRVELRFGKQEVTFLASPRGEEAAGTRRALASLPADGLRRLRSLAQQGGEILLTNRDSGRQERFGLRDWAAAEAMLSGCGAPAALHSAPAPLPGDPPAPLRANAQLAARR